LECGMTETEAEAQSAKAATTAACDEMTALCVGSAGKRDSGGAGCLRIHSLSFWCEGVPPRGDRKSAEELDSKAVAGAPLSKRVCISMKTISL
jgi:hypothetical protein